MNRIYHPWWKWEECRHNMWGSVDNREEWLVKAIEFTGDADLYGHWMMEVAKHWRYSCEHNLTHRAQNRKAWIGHAAVAMAIQCPEDIVREAWGHLTDQQREDANEKARIAIEWWEENNA